jgi:plastocyanin
MMRRRMASAAITSVLVLAAACGGGDAGPTAPPSPAPNPYRITITPSGVSPSDLVVPPGARVLFVNNDTRRHDMSSDPHPGHSDCPEINQAGLLQPGQSKETGNLVTIRTCGYHDHENPETASLRGRITIRQ